jgi:Family of unknown function (DUF6152)
MKNALASALALCALSGTAFPVLAHHGTSVTYDTSKSIVVEGTVTEWVYAFPHVQIYFDVPGADGKVAKWGTELAPTPSMMKNLNIGWNRNSVKPGDKLKLTCAPHRVADATACLAREIVINGKLMPLNEAQIKQAAAAPAQ